MNSDDRPTMGASVYYRFIRVWHEYVTLRDDQVDSEGHCQGQLNVNYWSAKDCLHRKNQLKVKYRHEIPEISLASKVE